jgi:hypothetical protein
MQRLQAFKYEFMPNDEQARGHRVAACAEEGLAPKLKTKPTYVKQELTQATRCELTHV